MDCCRTARAPALSWPTAATRAGGPLADPPIASSLLIGPAYGYDVNRLPKPDFICAETKFKLGSKGTLLLGQSDELELPKKGQLAEDMPNLWSCCA